MLNFRYKPCFKAGKTKCTKVKWNNQRVVNFKKHTMEIKDMISKDKCRSEKRQKTKQWKRYVHYKFFVFYKDQ